MKGREGEVGKIKDNPPSLPHSLRCGGKKKLRWTKKVKR